MHLFEGICKNPLDAGVAAISGPIGGVAGKGVNLICRTGRVCSAATGSIIGTTSSGVSRVLTNLWDNNPNTEIMEGVPGACVLGFVSGGLTGYFTYRAAGPSSVDVERARELAWAKANGVQNTKPQPGAAGALVVKNHAYTATSVKGRTPPVLHPEVQEFLDNLPINARSISHGRCAEPVCISQALDDGVQLNGAVSVAVKVRAPENPDHGALLPACASCRELLDYFGIYDGAK